MHCRKVRDLLSEYVDNRLRPGMRAEIDRHLASCADCSAELAFLQKTVSMVQDLPEAELPEDFRSQLHLRLAKAEAERLATPSAAARRTGFFSRAGAALRRPALRGALVGVIALAVVFSATRFMLPGWDGNVWTLLRGDRAQFRATGVPGDEPGGTRVGEGETTSGLGAPSLTDTSKGGAGELAATPPVSGTTLPGGLESLTGDQIIYTATLHVQVEKFDEAGHQVEQIVADAGGYLEQSSVSLDGKYKTGYYRIRVPQRVYAATLDKLEALGTVQQREEGTEDVSGTIIDLEARVNNLRRQELRLGELLGQAKNLDEILRVENELNRVRYQIEAHEGQLKWLRNRVAMSTITVNLSEPKEPVPSPIPGADLWKRIWRAFVETWRGIGHFLEGLAVFVASVIPVAVVLAGVWYGYRRWRSSRATRGPGL
jgi:hypothetical protein